jgi:hypothetical protein
MIKILPEDLNFLEELSKKINSQDKRSTSYPLFVVYDKVQVFKEDGEERERKEEETDGMCDKCLKLCKEGGDVPEDCDDCDDCQFYHFDWEDRIQENDGIYFTAEACDEYIQRRRYAFNKPYSYAISSYFSEEMKKVLEIISKFTSESNQSILK